MATHFCAFDKYSCKNRNKIVDYKYFNNMSFKLPIFDKRFFCIVDSDSVNIAALISSYTYNKDYYTPFFECKKAKIYKSEKIIEGYHEDFISVRLLEELDIKLNNALNLVGSCEYLVLGGLDEKQKSYFSFLDNYNVIDVQTEYDIHLFLGEICEKNGVLKSNEKSILHSLYLASKSNYYIEIDNSVEDYTIPNDIQDGIIVIEDINKSITVTAINYSLSIGASLVIISKPKIDARNVNSYIEDWANGNAEAINNLKAELYESIENIEFSKFKFATFFTIGIPYSLILDNIIPISHAHLYLRPDFFVFNCIYYETNFIIESGVVFSPLEFINEETEFVKNKLIQNNYNARELIGSTATAHNLDFNIKEFPYNILHICSHGGEINGYELNEKFKDRAGQIHTVKYDEVVTFAPSPKKKLIPVMIKRIIREFNGFDWRTDKEKKEKYPSYVFADMFEAISKIEKPDRKPIKDISDSCSIKCSDFNYQAMFNILAGIHSPIIFNNTCWSWSVISQAFISSGSRGYIGTLWSINNNIATKCAESFYQSLFDDTILNSLHQSLELAKGTRDENVYLYWGLHFTSLPKGESINESRLRITSQLLKSLERWNEKLHGAEDPIKKNIQEIIEWNTSQLVGDFLKELKSLIIRIEK